MSSQKENIPSWGPSRYDSGIWARRTTDGGLSGAFEDLSLDDWLAEPPRNASSAAASRNSYASSSARPPAHSARYEIAPGRTSSQPTPETFDIPAGLAAFMSAQWSHGEHLGNGNSQRRELAHGGGQPSSFRHFDLGEGGQFGRVSPEAMRFAVEPTRRDSNESSLSNTGYPPSRSHQGLSSSSSSSSARAYNGLSQLVSSEQYRPSAQGLGIVPGINSHGSQSNPMLSYVGIGGQGLHSSYSQHQHQHNLLLQHQHQLAMRGYQHHSNHNFRAGILPTGPNVHQNPTDKFRPEILRDIHNASRNDKKRYEAFKLEDIKGCVAQVCTDQVGSRFVQAQLVKAKPQVVDQFFNEMYENILTIVQDGSGNYVVQKILECGTQLHKTAILKALEGQIGRLAKNNCASRVVQMLLEKCLIHERQTILDEVRAVISELCLDLCGHHLVTKALNISANREQVEFIYDNVRGKVNEYARHPHGCIVLQTMLVRGTDGQRAFIVDELSRYYRDLCTHDKGNFVMQKILESCNHVNQDLVNIIVANVVAVSKTKSGSHVVEKLYELGVSDEARNAVMDQIMDPRTNAYRELCLDNYGNYVFKSLLLDLKKHDRERFQQDWRQVHMFLQFAKPQDGKVKKAMDALIREMNSADSSVPGSPSVMDPSSFPAVRTPSLTMEPSSPTSSPPSTSESAVDEPVNGLPLSDKTSKASPYPARAADNVQILN